MKFVMNKQLQKILTKKMDRKEFLIYLGVFFLAISGISGLLKNLSKLKPQKKTLTTNGSSAFGSRAYGA